MRFPAYTDVNYPVGNTNALSRLSSSIPSSYTVWYNSDDSKYYGECNMAGGSDITANTNAATVIQGAINALSSGNSICLKGSTTVYDLGSTQLTVNVSGISLFGEGLRSNIQYTGSDYAIVFSNGKESSSILNLRFTLGNTSPLGAVKIDNYYYHTLNRVWIYQSGSSTTQIGVLYDKSSGGTYWNKAIDLFVRYGGIGVKYDNGANANWLYAPTIRNVGDKGIYINDGAGIEVFGGRVESTSNNVVGVYSNDDFGSFHGVGFELTGTGTHAYEFGATADYNHVYGGEFNVSGSYWADAGTRNIIFHTKFQNSGSDTIANGTTSKVVAHGLSVTPSAEDFSIIGKEDPTNSVGTIWVDTIGAANFTVNVENDPGASGWDFGWRVKSKG